MKKSVDYQSFIEKRKGARNETIYFRYFIGIFAVATLWIFRKSLPFPYPHFLIVSIVFLSGNTIMHGASLLSKRLSDRIYNIWPYFDTAFAPLIFYCSGGFLSPFIVTHLVTAIGVSIVFPERKITTKIVYLMLVVSYTGVALLQKFGILAVHVPYAENMITNNVFFIFVVVGVNWIIGLCYVILKVVNDQLNELFETLKHTYDSIVRNISEYIVKDMFTSLVSGLAETLQTRCVFLGMVSPDGDTGKMVPVTVWDGNSINKLPNIEIKGSIFEKVIEEKELFIGNRVMEIFPDDTFLKSMHAEGFYGITLYSLEGKAVGVICTVHDSPFHDEYMVKSTLKIFASRAAAEIERKKVEGEFKEIQQQLAQSYKLEAMGQLAGGVAHDFNNVLHSIAGYCQILQKRLGVDSPLYNYPGKVITISKRASAFTNQFLSFARKDEFKKAPVEVHTLIDETVGMLERMIDKTIVIKTDLQPHVSPMINGDASLLQNIIINLVVNARDAMPGGGTVTIRTETVTIDEQFIRECPSAKNHEPGSYVLLSVSDIGHGMDEKIMARIFEPFYTTKEKGKGTGLGLAAVFNCIKNLNGFIAVASQVDKGSVFSVYLPQLEKAEQHCTAAPTEVVEESSSSQGRNILVADDDPSILEYTSETLLSYGFTVKTCNNGLEALDYFMDNYQQIDLVILNMSMPKLNGLQTYQKMKEINPSIKVLISTGYSLDDEARKILTENSSVDLILKPFRSKKLIKVIDRALA